MIEIEVIEICRIRDGGTIVYCDIYNRQYWTPASLFNDKSIYCAYPHHLTKSDEFRSGIRLKNIKLKIIESF